MAARAPDDTGAEMDHRKGHGVFDWDRFPKVLLRDLAREAGLRVSFARSDLAAEFGVPPGTDLVDRLWPVLRDRWLDKTPTSREAVVHALRAKGLGDKNTEIRTKSGQMKLLRSCRLSDSLRSIVLEEFISAGSGAALALPADDPASSVTVANERLSDHGRSLPPPDPSTRVDLPRSPDAGLRAIDVLHAQLLIDEEWTVRRPRGFTWWSYRLAQHIEAEEPFEATDGAIGSVVRIWTEVVRGIDPSRSTEVLTALAAFNMQASMSALVYDVERGAIDECATSVVYDDTIDSWAAVLATAALFQNTSAHSRALAVAELFGAAPASTDHPIGGQREWLDDLLNGPEAWVKESGALRSAFVGPLMSALGEFAASYELMSTGDDEGFTCELPFTDDRSAMELMGTDSNRPLGTALLQAMTDQGHPQLGSGALWLLKLPLPKSPDAALIANDLNITEALGLVRTKLLGSWCAHDGELTYVSFLPSMIARPGILENLLADAFVRVAWVREVSNSESER